MQEMIITDLTRINLKQKNPPVNRKLQNFCIENMLEDPNKKAARKTLNIMITLYKKKIWNDNKSVNAIANCCYSKDPKIAFAAGQFFLTEFEEIEDESDDEEKLDEMKNKYKLLGKNSSKKTKQRKTKLKNLMKTIERREKRKSKTTTNKDFMPIDLLNDPSNFSERLFSKLKSLKENFKLKLSLMRLIGRILGRHKLYIDNFYNHMLSFIATNQNELPMIFASLIESLHENIPPSEIEPIIEKLFDAFITEVNPHGYITIGINALREICERSPYVMNKDRLKIIENIKEIKDKSVSNAAKSLLNLYKEFDLNMEDLYDK
jgi:protein SDA1